ncbi:MAG: metal-dependent hydrolase [Pyrinomonadaceae bacterium]|nr:metal-dependent hydrolase [Pyrinomonadaceae bacterium]
MDNLTHSLVGLAAAKAGLERVSPYATGVCIVAANLPDADIVAAFDGQWNYLHHHRGITHSIIGTLVLAVLVPVVFYVGDFIVARIKRRDVRARFGGLLLASLILSATHPLFDWTNNYGVRPLLPWSDAWYYGDLVFIIDPWLWLSLGGAAFLLTTPTKWRVAAWSIIAVAITGAIILLPLRSDVEYPLVSRVLWAAGLVGLVFAHRAQLAARWGASIAAAALALVVVYWAGLSVMHHKALQQARAVAGHVAAENREQVVKVAAMPTLANPLRWRCVMETNLATYRFELVTNNSDGYDAVARDVLRIKKLADEEALWVDRQIAADQRAQILLAFARFPVTRLQGGCLSATLVQFADLRYTEPGASRGNFALEIPVAEALRSEEMIAP